MAIANATDSGSMKPMNVASTVHARTQNTPTTGNPHARYGRSIAGSLRRNLNTPEDYSDAMAE